MVRRLSLHGFRCGARRRCARAVRPVAPAGLLLLLAVTQGCYGYHTTELPRLTPGEEVRLELADRERTRIPGTSAMIGQRRFEGRFARLTEDSVIVSVWIGQAYAGTPFEATYQDVVLPRDEVARVENRQLDKIRTGLMAAGAVAVIAYLIDTIGVFEIFPGGGGEAPPAPPEFFPGR